jgi:hypothetical protein
MLVPHFLKRKVRCYICRREIMRIINVCFSCQNYVCEMHTSIQLSELDYTSCTAMDCIRVVQNLNASKTGEHQITFHMPIIGGNRLPLGSRDISRIRLEKNEH